MQTISKTNRILGIHCENQSIIDLNLKRFNKAQRIEPIDHTRSRPEISEMEAIQRVILLAQETGVRLHILHLSSARSMQFIKEAKRCGYPVTVETCPHYLLLTEEALNSSGPYAKCNPPLRDQANMDFLWNELLAGNIDCLVSDHSPYTSQDKAKGLNDIRLAPPGIAGVELGLSLMVNEMNKHNRIDFCHLGKLMSTNPAKLFGLYPRKGTIMIGSDADFVLVDPKEEWIVDAQKLHTKNKWTPYNGWRLTGKVIRTILRGKTVYLADNNFPQGPGFGNFIPIYG